MATKKKAKTVQVLVAVDDQHTSRLDAVAQRCRKAGLKVDETLAEIGVLTGSIPADKIAALSAVEGVANVERSGETQIAPPDAGVQ